jgi:hypothetical protein
MKNQCLATDAKVAKEKQSESKQDEPDTQDKIFSILCLLESYFFLRNLRVRCETHFTKL